MAGLLVPLSNTGRDEILCWWWDTTIGFPSCCFYWFCWFWLVLLFYMLLALVLSFWNISLYFVPGLLRRQKLKFVFYFSLSNIHNMFRQYALVTWYLIYDWQKHKKHNRSHKELTKLSLSPASSQEKWGPSPKVKKASTLSFGWLCLSSNVLDLRHAESENSSNCCIFRLRSSAQVDFVDDEEVEPLGARTPPTTWLNSVSGCLSSLCRFLANFSSEVLSCELKRTGSSSKSGIFEALPFPVPSSAVCSIFVGGSQWALGEYWDSSNAALFVTTGPHKSPLL